MVFLPDLTKSIFADRSALPPASAKAPPAGIVLSARPAALSRRQKIFNTARFLLRPAEIHPCGAASSQQGFPLRRRFRADKKIQHGALSFAAGRNLSVRRGFFSAGVSPCGGAFASTKNFQHSALSFAAGKNLSARCGFFSAGPPLRGLPGAARFSRQ